VTDVLSGVAQDAVLKFIDVSLIAKYITPSLCFTP
jgi:hypothetical protein